MICKKCGAENAPNKKTCKRCGKDLSAEREEVLYYDLSSGKKPAFLYSSGGLYYGIKNMPCTLLVKTLTQIVVGDVVVLGSEKYELKALYDAKNEKCERIEKGKICAVCLDKMINRRFLEGVVENCPRKEEKYVLFRVGK